MRKKASGPVPYFLILVLLHSSMAWAVEPRDRVLLPEEVGTASPAAEYVSGKGPGTLLMTVNLWGNVARPGVHHIPLRTDLATLLSLAGGPGSEADLSRIVIRHQGSEKEQLVSNVDLAGLLADSKGQPPILQSNDIILIPQNRPTISTNTMNTVGFIGTIAGVLLSVVAVSLAVRNN